MPKSLVNVLFVVVLIVWAGFSMISTYLVFVGNAVIYAENGFIENIQVAALVIAFLLFFLTALFKKTSDRLVLFFFALLWYSFLLREIDMEKLNIPYIFQFLGAGIGRNFSILIGFLIIAVVALKSITFHKRMAVSFIKTKSGVLLLLAGLLLFIGDFFEKQSFIPHHVFFEELFELSAYVLILLSALRLDSFVTKPAVNGNLNESCCSSFSADCLAKGQTR